MPKKVKRKVSGGVKVDISYITHKGTGEEDTLGESASSIRDPLQSPVGLLRDARDYQGYGLSGPWSMNRRLSCAAILTSINGIEQVGPSGGVLDVSVDQQRVGLGVNILPV
jgi:hypothetical protein